MHGEKDSLSGWETKDWESGEILDEGMVSDLLSCVILSHQALQEKTSILFWQMEVSKSIE